MLSTITVEDATILDNKLVNNIREFRETIKALIICGTAKLRLTFITHNAFQSCSRIQGLPNSCEILQVYVNKWIETNIQY